MMGIGDKKDASVAPLVPQNSFIKMQQRMGLMEQDLPGGHQPNTSVKSGKGAVTHCAHCDNMAKNFLYLESLVRSNYNQKSQCSLCYSTLKYLQYVNKNIAQVFGNYDSIVEAAKAFTRRSGYKGKITTQPAKPTPKVRSATLSREGPKAAGKQKVEKVKLKAGRLLGGSASAAAGPKAGGSSRKLSVLPKSRKTSSKRKLVAKKAMRVVGKAVKAVGDIKAVGGAITSPVKIKAKKSSLHRVNLKAKKPKTKRGKKGSALKLKPAN